MYIVVVVIVLCSLCIIVVLCFSVFEVKVVWTKWSLRFLFLSQASMSLLGHSSWRLSSSSMMCQCFCRIGPINLFVSS